MVSQPRAFNTRVWNQFLGGSVSLEMTCYLAQKASNVVERKPDLCIPINQPPSTRQSDRVSEVITAREQLDDQVPLLETFISSVVRQSNVQVSTLMTTLLYLARLRSKLAPTAEGTRSTPHRIFLACLILSEKFLNDFSPYNKHWASYSRVGEFSLSNFDVNIMEKQLLFLLDWNLKFEPSELEQHCEPFLTRIRDSTVRMRNISFKGNRRVSNKGKPRGDPQLSNTNMKNTSKILKREAKNLFHSRTKNLVMLESPVVAIKQSPASPCSKTKVYEQRSLEGHEEK
jgi:hypothetical protein